MKWPSFSKNKLQKCTRNTPLFTIRGMIKAKVVSVYDGDTFDAVFKFDRKYQRFKIRCLGYDSEEIRQPLDCKDREEKKEKARKDRDELAKWILDKIIYLDCRGFDKYGRVLAKVYTESGMCVNTWMVQNGFGKSYDAP